MSLKNEDRLATVTQRRAVFYVYAAAALLLTIVTSFLYVRKEPFHNLFDLSFCVGETSRNLIAGNGISCYTFAVLNHGFLWRAARMPVATLYAAGAALLIGPTQIFAATIIKAVLLLLPVLGVARMVLYRCTRSKLQLTMCATLLAIPFAVPNFLADIVNLQVEEGYAYAFLIAAYGLVALGPRGDDNVTSRYLWLYTLATAFLLDLLYLSKSSMILAVATLLAFSVFRNGPMWSRVLLFLLVAAAPLGWAVRQHAVSGRYAVGTSWDSANLHKGNNEHFLSHYPPAIGANLDFYDAELAPREPLGTEWAYSDWHKHQAVQFIYEHPKATAIATWKKFYVYFLSFKVYGNGSIVSLPNFITLTGMVLFRLLLFTATGSAIYVVFRSRDGRRHDFAVLYLILLVTVASPYLVGFGYTRHASVLIYPSAMAMCLLWSRSYKVFAKEA